MNKSPATNVSNLEYLKTLPKYPFEQYAALPKMNASTLAHGCDTMLALKNAIDGKKTKKTKQMMFGNKYHELILEPELFEERYVVLPNYALDERNRTLKGGQSTSWASTFAQESKEEFLRQAADAGQQVILEDEYERGLRMCEAVQKNPLAKSLIDNSEAEVTLLGEIDDVPFKGRVDLAGEVCLADLKGTTTCCPVKFGNSAMNLHYPFKLAIYRELYRQNLGFTPEVFIIAVETANDYDCVVFDVYEQLLDDQFDHVRKVISNYKKCLNENRWPGADEGSPEPIPLHVPNWSMQDGEDGLFWSPELGFLD